MRDDGSLWCRETDGGERCVSGTAPWVACDLVDVDDGARRCLVRVPQARGGHGELAVAREELMSQSRVIQTLSPLGANVSSTNCREVIRYLTDCERAFARQRPLLRSSRHLGWADAPLGAFMPYDALGGEVRFDPAPDGAAKASPFLEPAGTLAEWVAGMSPVRESSPAFRCVLAASFASPLVAVVGAQPFVCYLWGDSRSGKTPTLKAAGSVWGDPTEGGAYFRSFSDTPKSIARGAALLRDVPVIIDDLQSKGARGGQRGKRQAVEDLIYSLSIGHERGALNSDRTMMASGSWRSITIATGEIPIVGGSTQRGAANRVLELNAEPFAEQAAAQAMHLLVGEQHGTAGRAYVAALRRNGVSWYRGERARIRGLLAEAFPGHPQVDSVALLALADELASLYVFGYEGWDACARGAMGMARWALTNSSGAMEADTDLKAIRFVLEWLERSRLHFEGSAETDRLERWGEVERSDGRELWWVFSEELGDALADAGFDRQKTLRRMDAEKVLLRAGGASGSKRFTRLRRIRGGGRVWCVCIDAEAAAELLLREEARADSLASASSGAAPGDDGGR